ncbi:MAG: sugar ABC transporter ATP-binding protein [Pseudomonadota bacterium]
MSGSDLADPARAELIRLEGVSKRFPGVLALDGVDFDLRAGEVHVLFGENGAGKSTLINLLAGTYASNEGRFLYLGGEVAGLTPYRARRMGISSVFQEFSLIPELSVEQNLFLGQEHATLGILRPASMRQAAGATLADLGFDVQPQAKVIDLSRAHQQMVEIAKALLHDVRVLVLDEPTASLTESESEKLFSLVERLKAQGIGVIYVSHRLAEIKRIADRVTVLRDGRRIATVRAQDVSAADLVEMMTGRKVEVFFPHIDHRPAAEVLRVDALTLDTDAVNDVSIRLHAGEIVGVAGLVGCGKGELARAIFGLEPISSGSVLLDGAAIDAPTPSEMLDRGVCYFPSDRVAEGLALVRPVRENASSAALYLPELSHRRFLRLGSERRLVKAIMERLHLRARSIEQTVEHLSGGNRQKVMLARGLSRETRVFLFDEPTVGIDVGAKIEIYNLLKTLADQGAAVMLVSSELPEVLHLANRLYVMHRSRIVAELRDDEITEEAVLSCLFDRERTPAL